MNLAEATDHSDFSPSSGNLAGLRNEKRKTEKMMTNLGGMLSKLTSRVCLTYSRRILITCGEMVCAEVRRNGCRRYDESCWAGANSGAVLLLMLLARD